MHCGGGAGAGSAFAFLEESTQTDLEPTNPFHQFLVVEAAVAASSAAAAAASGCGGATPASTNDKIQGSGVKGAGASRRRPANAGAAVPLAAQSPPTVGSSVPASDIARLSEVAIGGGDGDDLNPFHKFLDAAVAEVVAESESGVGNAHALADTLATPDARKTIVDENNHYDMLTPNDALKRRSRASTVSPPLSGGSAAAAEFEFESGAAAAGGGGGETAAGSSDTRSSGELLHDASNYGLLDDIESELPSAAGGGAGRGGGGGGEGGGGDQGQSSRGPSANESEQRPSRPKRPSIRTMSSLKYGVAQSNERLFEGVFVLTRTPNHMGNGFFFLFFLNRETRTRAILLDFRTI